MRLTHLHDIPGLTLDDKLEHVLNTADNRLVWVQPKHNGIMGVWNNGNMWTRQDKKYKPGAFSPRFYQSLAHIPSSIIAYGELTVPDVPFQEAVGLLSVNRLPIELDTVEYIVHDVFDTAVPVNEQPYSVRLSRLNELFGASASATIKVKTADEIKSLFLSFTGTNGEGIVIRAEPAFICVSTPSPQIIKWKKVEDGEGVCVSVYEGQGKRKGTLGGFVIRLPSGTHVNIGGGKGLNDAMLDRLWKNPPLGKKITFAYEMLSSAGVPLKPQFLSVRDYE